MANGFVFIGKPSKCMEEAKYNLVKYTQETKINLVKYTQETKINLVKYNQEAKYNLVTSCISHMGNTMEGNKIQVNYLYNWLHELYNIEYEKLIVFQHQPTYLTKLQQLNLRMSQTILHIKH